jgi:hypothetical protein
VDNQPALSLLQDLATTADGVLWSATHLLTGQYLYLEDTHARPSMMILLMGPAGKVIIGPDPDPDAAVRLSACDIPEDDVEWVQDSTDVATVVSVVWNEQTAPPAGTIEHTETVKDELLGLMLGIRRTRITSKLASSAAAAALGSAVLYRTSDRGWRVAGLTWDTGLHPLSPDDVAAAFTLLDGTTRLGAALLITDLPAWSPATNGNAPVFLEGGRYHYTAGDWVLELTTSTATTQGGSLTWDQLDPAWAWDQFDPTISWDSLRGVGA